MHGAAGIAVRGGGCGLCSDGGGVGDMGYVWCGGGACGVWWMQMPMLPPFLILAQETENIE